MTKTLFPPSAGVSIGEVAELGKAASGKAGFADETAVVKAVVADLLASEFQLMEYPVFHGSRVVPLSLTPRTSRAY